MRRLSLVPVLAALLTPTVAFGQQPGPVEEAVPVPATIVNDGVPEVPARIQKEMERYSALKSAGFVDWLPGGQGLLVATRLEGMNTSQLFKLDRAGGELTRLTDFEEPVTSAVVNPDPDKSYFVFSKDVGGNEQFQYYRYDLATGESSMITDGESRHMGLMFNHAGTAMAYVNNSRTGQLFDVYVMDPEKPESARIVYEAQRPAYYIPTAFSADDRHLVVIEYISANEVNSYYVDLEGGEIVNVTPESDEPVFFGMASVSRDGKSLFGITDLGSEFQKLVRYDLATGTVTPLTSDIEWNVNFAADTEDESLTAFVTNEDGISRLYLMDGETFEYQRVDGIPVGLISGLSFDKAGKRLAMNLNSARLNGDVFVMDVGTQELTRWTRSDTGGLELDSFVEPELIHYPTFDEVDGRPREIPAFYYRPADETARPFPVVINIHGGPEGQFRPSFLGSLNYAINELGIAVIAPNVRGSSGYGKSYLLMDNAEKRENSVGDIGALLDWIDRQPELDKSRVAVYGGSYGGYMVLSSMFHYNDRLAAGVDIVGISNFVTFLKNTSPYRQDLRRAEYGDEREIGAFLNEISPTTNAHLIRKPLFVIQGAQDPRVPASEAAQIVETVRENGVPVWYQVATNEGHGFRKKDNRDFMNYSIIRFYEEFLLK